MVLCLFLSFNDTATTEIYTYGHTLSLHDALPIWVGCAGADGIAVRPTPAGEHADAGLALVIDHVVCVAAGIFCAAIGVDQARQPQPRAEIDQHVLRSEEHTSELQSLMRNSYAVFCLNKHN